MSTTMQFVHECNLCGAKQTNDCSELPDKWSWLTLIERIIDETIILDLCPACTSRVLEEKND